MIDIAKDELIDLRAVADKLGVALQTVNLWRRRGRLECVKVGGRWYTTADALNAFAVRNDPPRTASPPMPMDPAFEESMRDLELRFGRKFRR